jgi:hypothetical protein
VVKEAAAISGRNVMSPEFYFPSILSLHSQIGAVELYKVIIPSFKGKGKKNKSVKAQKKHHCTFGGQWCFHIKIS